MWKTCFWPTGIFSAVAQARSQILYWTFLGFTQSEQAAAKVAGQAADCSTN